MSISPPDPDNSVIRYSVKDLLADIRADVRAIDVKLDMKADRGRVHDLANRIAAIEIQGPLRDQVLLEFRTSQTRISALESWRNRLAGGLAVVSILAGAGFFKVYLGI